MSAPKPLKDLPGFDEALARIDFNRYPGDYAEVLSLVVSATIPCLGRAHAYFIEQLALMVWVARDEERREERRRIRLVPPPRPIVANDCEAP